MKSSHKTALALLAGAALGALAVQGLHAQAKPPVYLVSLIDVSNVDAYTKEYVPKVRATIKAAGGKLLAASQKVAPVEGEAPTSRVAINVWDSEAQMRAWRDSAAYKDAREIGNKYAKFRSFLVDGVPQ